MAAKGLDIDRETFCCSVCLDLLKDPVTIPCGHSYCMSCVNTHWDGEVGKQSYSCPQCRQNFTQRPVLVKNTMLAVLMEGLKKSAPPAAPLPPSAAPGEVFCDLCSGREVKAVKSCLQCQVSYCKEHLQPHYDVAALKKHKLMEPTENLQENMCSRHDEVMKMFCRTDQQCICYLCSVDQHKGHHTVTAAAERAEKQRELQAFEQNILQKIKLKEKNVHSLQQQVKNNSLSAYEAVQLSDRSLKDLLQLLEKRINEVKQEVRSQQKAEELRINDLQDTVQQELTELRRRLTEVDTLSHTEDHVTFLHKFPSLSKIRETSESVKSSQTPPPFKDTVTAAVSKLRSTLEETILFDQPTVVHKPKVNTATTDALPAAVQKLTFSVQGGKAPSPPLQSPGKPPAAVHKPKVNAPKAYAPPPGPQATAPPQQISEEDFPALPSRNLRIKTPTKALQPNARPTSASPSKPSGESYYNKMKKYARKITWDPLTVNDKLELSNENLSVQRTSLTQNPWHHPFRFTSLPQALSKETLSGQCYFEVSLYYEKSCAVGVAHKDIKRDGPSNQCSLGKNAKSWALECFRDRCFVWHNGQKVEISYGAQFVGVFVDYKAGVLTFYRQNCQLEPVYTFKTSFTQPLVACVRLDHVGTMVAFCSRMFWNTDNLS